MGPMCVLPIASDVGELTELVHLTNLIPDYSSVYRVSVDPLILSLPLLNASR